MKYLYFSALGLKSLLVVRKHTLILSPASSFQDKHCALIKHKSIVSDLMPSVFFFFLKKKAKTAFIYFCKIITKANY